MLSSRVWYDIGHSLADRIVDRLGRWVVRLSIPMVIAVHLVVLPVEVLVAVGVVADRLQSMIMNL